MGERDAPSTSRIAIKLGSASTSHAAKNAAARPKPPSSLGKRLRPHALNGDSDSDREDDRNSGRHEAISSFGPNGASGSHDRTDRAESQPHRFVVERLPNRDWRSQVKGRRRGRLPHEAEAPQNGEAREVEPADKDKDIQWGLSIRQSAKDKGEGGASDSESRTDRANDARHSSEDVVEQDAEWSADQRALDALLGNSTTPSRDAAVIPRLSPRVTEDDAYQRDVQEAGEVSTLEDYESMPVEEFGAALLRGMGWDGKHKGKIHEVKRRANLIGLGAKELKGAEDLGAWNQKDGRPRPPRLNDYNREEEKRRDKRRERRRERDR